MAMKRLFQCEDQFFDNKQAAKTFRDGFNKGESFIKLGLDHDRYGKQGKTRSGRSHSERDPIGDGFPKKRK